MEKIMDYTLFFVSVGGLFFLLFTMSKWGVSKTQLQQPADYQFLRRKTDQGIARWLQTKSRSTTELYLKNMIKRWEMWSDIGIGRSLSVSWLLSQSCAGGILFAWPCYMYTHSWLLTFLSVLVGGALPIFILKARFSHVAFRARRKGLLPFIDVYKNAYLRANENIITAFHISQSDCPSEMRPVLDWLLRRLHNGSLQKEGLREFADILRSEWAHIFVNYLISGLEGEAKNIARPLIQLQIDMHSTRDEEEDREVITVGAFYSNFVIIFLTIVGIVFLASLLPMMKRFFISTDAGHSLLACAFISWIVMILYSFFQMKGGNL